MHVYVSVILFSTDLPVDFSDKDISIISEALKLFLEELPDPLIPFSLHNKFIEAESEHSAIMCNLNILCHKMQAHNQTFLEGGSKPGMVTQMNSKWGSLATCEKHFYHATL